jgi:membrane protein DedA with SNARE-associated domain
MMVVEGPIITAAAAFVASLGYLNVWIILFLALLGNFIPDTLLFLIGRWGRKAGIERFVHRLGLRPSRMKLIERDMKKHACKTLIIVKLIPLLPIPGIILAGFMKVPIKKFLLVDILFNVVGALIFTSMGFYAGWAINNIFKYLKIGQYVLLLLIPLVIVVYIVYKRFSSYLGKKLQMGRSIKEIKK